MLSEFLKSVWDTTLQLSPWLLVGMALSGIAHVLLPAGWIRRRFQGYRGVASAVVLGVPLPLCSCGVIPAGIGLKNDGASNGAALGFLISTPQTGVDSILISAAFFGWPFAWFKMAGALVLGLIGGWLTEFLDGAESSDSADTSGKSAPSRFEDRAENDTTGQAGQATDDTANPVTSQLTETSSPNARRTWRDGLRFSIEILRSIWLWLAIGIAVSALLDVVVPQQWIQSIGDWGLLPSMLAVLVISTPLYVCATASVPIAAALVHSGFPPAAALVFLVAGPATNATTIGAVYGRFGIRVLAIYLTTIIVGSLFLAWAFASLVATVAPAAAGHNHEHVLWWAIASAVIVVGLMTFFAIERAKRVLKNRHAPNDKAPQLVVEISGMNCNGCVERLTRSLEKVDGVQRVHVQLDPPNAVVVGNVKLESLQEAARRCGLQLREPMGENERR